MGGSPSGSSGSGTGSRANVYTPTAQGGADQAFQGIIQQLMGAGAGPAGTNYPTGQQFVDQYLTYSPYAAQAQGAADNAGNIALANYGPQQTAGSNLMGAAQGGLPYAGQALSMGFNPAYGTLANDIMANPFLQQALGGAQQAAGIGTAGADQLAGGVGPLLAGIGPLLAGAGTTLNTAFDPQNQLFNRGQQQSLDASSVANAMAGIGGTPYGASVTDNALNNYGINWQNQQLGRQESGLGAYGSALGRAGSTLGQAGSTLGQATNLASSSSALPSNVYTNQINQILQALGMGNQAAASGAGTFGSLLGSAGSGSTAGAGMENSALAQYLSGQQQNYNTGVNFGQNALSGLSSVTNLGNQQYLLPQQVIADLESYMGLGQSASGISGQLGQMGFNQLASGLGGGIAGANALFGSGGAGSGLLGGAASGLGSLLGGGSGAAGVFDSTGALLGPSLAGTSTAALDLAAGAGGVGGGGGSALAAALPFAASA